VFDALSRHPPENAVVTVDVGNHAYSLGRYLESAGQPVLMSGYLGSIGFGYPAALGAWAADPSRPVVAVTGDGGFAQYASGSPSTRARTWTPRWPACSPRTGRRCCTCTKTPS